LNLKKELRELFHKSESTTNIVDWDRPGGYIKAPPLQPLPTAMTITVKSLGSDTVRNLPYYPNMRVGQYATQVASPALGCILRGSDVYDPFVLNGAHVFTKDNKDKYLSEVMQDGATLHHSLCLGRIDQCLIGNGSCMPPTPYQLTLHSSNEVVVGPSAGKKRKV
jgi:hypothetical protein